MPGRIRTISQHEDDAVEDLGKEDFDKAKQEEQLTQEVVEVQESLSFDIVDIGVEYGQGFKGRLNVFEGGRKETVKISCMFY